MKRLFSQVIHDRRGYQFVSLEVTEASCGRRRAYSISAVAALIAEFQRAERCSCLWKRRSTGVVTGALLRRLTGGRSFL